MCIAEYIADNKTLKTLKLLRNKITDEGGIALVKALMENRTLQTLNLTQNLLSEKTVDAFLGLIKVNPSLKTLYFNQNSIKIMHVKNKIKELQKLGTNTSI